MLESQSTSGRVPTWFAQRVLALFGLYPNASMQPMTILTWWNHLRDLSEATVIAALAKAPGASSLFVPTAQTVREIALALPRDTGRQAQCERLRQLPEATRSLAADNPFLVLARKWEEESRDLGLDPDRPSPRQVAQGRLHEIDGLLDRCCCHDLNDVVAEKRPATNREHAA